MTIKEYWNLIGREPFLAITWEPDFSQACSFCRMLMNHKNFHFTQNPVFGPFLVIFAQWGFFTKNPAVTGNYIRAPNTMLSFRKKLMSQSQENLQTDRRTDGQILFYRTLPVKTGCPITSLIRNDLLRLIIYKDKSFNKENNGLDCNHQIHKRYTTFWKISLLIYTNHPWIITVDK